MPFHCTVEEEMNPDPVIVNDVCPEPATAEDGVTAAMAGMGFKTGGGFVEAGIPPPQPVMKNMDDRTEARRAVVVAWVPGSNGLRCCIATSWSRIEQELCISPQG